MNNMTPKKQKNTARPGDGCAACEWCHQPQYGKMIVPCACATKKVHVKCLDKLYSSSLFCSDCGEFYEEVSVQVNEKNQQILVIEFSGEDIMDDVKSPEVYEEPDESHETKEELEVQSSIIVEDTILKLLEALAEDLFKMKEYNESCKLLERILDIQEQLYGTDDKVNLKVLAKLEKVYNLLGKHERRCDVLERSLDIYLSIFGEYHPRVSRTMALLAETYSVLGEYELQRDLMERSMDIIEYFAVMLETDRKRLLMQQHTKGKLGILNAKKPNQELIPPSKRAILVPIPLS